MSARTRMILAIIGVVIICALFFFLFIRSRQGELSQIRTNIEAEENRALELTTELNRLKDLQERAPELEAELARIRELVPQEHDVPHFIFLMQDTADEAGVDFLEMTPELPKTPPEAAPLAQVRMTIVARGSYFSVQDFLRRLYDADRAVRIDTLTMGGEETEFGVELALNLQVRVFFELPAPPDPAAEGDNVPAPTAPVGSSPTPATEGAP